MNMEKKADDLLRYGRYHAARDLFNQLLTQATSEADKAHFKGEIDACDLYIKENSRVDIGEACFPVYFEPIGAAIPLTVIISKNISDNTPQYLSDVFDSVKPLLSEYLDQYILKNVANVLVFDWGLDEYSISIKNFPNHDNKYDEIVNGLDGKSIMLAIFVAALSAIVKTPVPIIFAFSASLEKIERKILLKSIGRQTVDDKVAAILNERPWVTTIILPHENEYNHSNVSPVSTVEEVVNIVFPELPSILNEKKAELGRDNDSSIRLTTYDKVEAFDGQHHYYLKFEHGMIALENIAKIIRYFEKLPKKFVNQKDGVIIDGLMMNIMTPLLLLQRSVFNHVSNFIAIRYTGSGSDRDKKEGVAIVVRTSNTNATRKLGEYFKYTVPYDR